MRPFKNALCLSPIPDAPGYSYPPWQLCCHRRHRHPGRHRVIFRDGGIREWSTGDRDSILTKKGRK